MAHKDTRKSRVLLTAAGLFLGLGCLWARVAYLQTVLHEHYAARARENQQHHEKLLPHRGVLTDRRGKVLAHDLGVSEVAVYPPQLGDRAEAARVLAPLVGEKPARLAKRLQSLRSYTWIARDLPPEVGQRIRDANLPGVVVDDIEYQFENLLGGRTGWITMVPTGSSHMSLLLPGAEGRPARDGASLELTLDADLQGIVEHHLSRAVDTLGAKRGFAVFLDPWSGEVLAAACWPHLPPGQAKNWTFTDQYEPGSTFKVVVSGATLEERLARPEDRFEASPSGEAELVPGCVIHDTHELASMTFRQAVQLSSNIVMGRLALRLGAERLHRYASALGFGSMSGVEFPGEAAGRLRPVRAWQPRSTPTIAIGHEITVTPLQLALAYATVANGGVLMQPVLVRSIRDADGRELRRGTPRPSHRVFSEATAATLIDMLCAVVDSGTATSARLPGLMIAGKTGTAQKYDASVGTYGRGMYVASFAGIAPADHPRVVGVVVIDARRDRARSEAAAGARGRAPARRLRAARALRGRRAARAVAAARGWRAGRVGLRGDRLPRGAAGLPGSIAAGPDRAHRARGDAPADPARRARTHHRQRLRHPPGAGAGHAAAALGPVSTVVLATRGGRHPRRSRRRRTPSWRTSRARLSSGRSRKLSWRTPPPRECSPPCTIATPFISTRGNCRRAARNSSGGRVLPGSG